MTDRADEVAAGVVGAWLNEHDITSSQPRAAQFQLEERIAAALRAYAEEVRREEREAWLNRAAKIERKIAGDSRHTKQEIGGAHMLGACLRAATAAIRARGEGEG